jgi:glyceraldehyde 3-phosphate dehydrogenase
MTINIGINGFGRIGRLVFRIIESLRLSGTDIKVVGINDLVNAEQMMHLLKYDSVHKKFDFEVEITEKSIIINENEIKRLSERDPSKINWDNVDYVIESTGHFTTLEKANLHLLGGAKKVIITSPSNDAPMFVMGVNHEDYNNEDIVSNASCSTNCLAPLAKILNDNFGIEYGLMSTIHSMTSSQKVVDGPNLKNWRAGRSANMNIIPSSTGAARCVGKVIPELEGKLNGMSFRVPVNNVSVVDFTVKLKNDVEYQDIVNCIKDYSDNSMKDILGYTEEELVSTDFVGDSRSCIVDIKAGINVNNNLFKLVGWYDNEWAYSCRVVDLLFYMDKKN